MRERISLPRAEEEAENIRTRAKTKAVDNTQEPTSDEYHDAALDIAAEKERVDRPERLRRLTEQVEQLFPGEDGKAKKLREAILTSFNVPQFGQYHQEGLFMDTHLDLILENIDDIRNGRFLDTLPQDIRGLLQRVAQQSGETLERYTFLHDIAKKDCLRIRYMDDRIQELSWEQWQAMVPPAAATDPVALRAFCKEQKIKGISYFQNKKGNRQHGPVGTKFLRGFGEAVPVPPAVFTAIDEHEATYNCHTVDARYYGKHLGRLPREERDLALVANYIDTDASLRRSQLPDFGNFLRFVDSKHNFELIEEIEHVFASRRDCVQQKVRKALDRLRASKERIKEPVEDLVAMIAAESKPDTSV